MITELEPHEETGLLRQLRTMSGSLFEKHLHGLLRKADQELRHCSQEDFLRRQGRAQLLEELIGAIQGARTALERVERGKPDMSKAF